MIFASIKLWQQDLDIFGGAGLMYIIAIDTTLLSK